jgi:hypothetical protein
MREGMTDRDDLLAWVRSALYDAELVLHDGDAPRRREPRSCPASA